MSPRLVLLCALICSACSTRPPPSLVAITPSSTTTGTAVDVMIDGADFARLIRVDLDRPVQSTVDQTFALSLGDVPLEQVEYLDAVQLRAHVPGTLAAGVYSLTLVDPYGRSAALPDSFTVSDLPQPTLRIEDAAGGTGSEVGDVQVRVGQRVSLFAVGRLPSGAFTADLAATWGMTGVGALSSTGGSMVSWSTSTPGTARVEASAAGLGSDTTGALTAVPCTQASDCSDACTTSVSCVGGACVSGSSTLDADGDGFISALCPGGNDCNDRNGAVHPGATEGPEGDATCTDGLDNDCDGQTDFSQMVCRPNTPPVAVLTLTPQVATVGDTFTGSSAGSRDAEDAASALTYDWDWDGDGAYEKQGATSTHSYSAAGTSRVVLRVTDTRGAVAFATATALVVSSAANIVTVTTGVDENDVGATPAVPLGAGLSLREAVRWATTQPGAQTIVIPSGTTVALTSQLDFTDNAGITLAGNGAVIDGAGISGGGSSCFDLSGRNHRIDGLEIKNCPGWPIYTHGQDCVVTRCKVHDNRYGVELAGNNDIFGPDNEVFRNGSYGIDVNATVTVIGNVFRNTAGPGINLRGGLGSTVVGNFSWDNDRGIAVASQCDNVKVWHNTLFGSARDGMRLSPASNGHDVRNNLITDNGAFGIDTNNGSIAVIDANDFFQNASGACSSCPTLGPKSLAVAPGYVDSMARDLRIFKSSPVANAGVDTGADRNGPAPGNFNGTAPDLGAYEAP